MGLVLLLSRSPGQCGPSNPGLSLSVTYPPSGIWGGAATGDDEVRWGPVASVWNGPSAGSFLFSNVLSHMYNAHSSPEEDETDVDVELEYCRQLNALR